MERLEKLALLLAHLLAAFLTFVFIAMASELGFGLRILTRGGSRTLGMIFACGLADYALLLFSTVVLLFNIGPAIVAWRTDKPSLARAAVLTGAVLELVFAMLLFAVVVYNYLLAGMPL